MLVAGSVDSGGRWREAPSSLGSWRLFLPSLAFPLGLHLPSCACLSCLGAGEPWGELLPVDFWQ